MPANFIQNIEQTYNDRKTWKTMRYMDVQKTNKEIYKQNGNLDAYREAIENVSKLHQAANKVA